MLPPASTVLHLVSENGHDVEWLLEPGLLWKAVTIDAAEVNITTDRYLQDLVEAMARFEKSDAVHDREQAALFILGEHL